VHMKDEREFRHREIAAALIDVGVEVVIYDAGRRHPTQRQVREECLRAVVTDAAAEAWETRLVLEQDDSLVQWDAQRLIELARATGCRDRLRYDHLRAVGGAAVGGAGCGGVVLGMRRGVAPPCGPRRTSDPPGVSPHGPGNARSPSAASVRTGLGLTSRSSTQRAPLIIRGQGGTGQGRCGPLSAPPCLRNQDAQNDIMDLHIAPLHRAYFLGGAYGDSNRCLLADLRRSQLTFVVRESDGLGLRESYGACWVSSGGGEIGWFIVRQGPPRAGVRVTRM